mgnify:CR=1 FL=1
MCTVPRAPPNHGTPVADYFSCASCNGGLENERAKVVEKMALIKFLLVYILQQVGFCLFPDGWDPVVAVNCALILASHPFFANFCGSQPGLPDSSPWNPTIYNIMQKPIWLMLCQCLAYSTKWIFRAVSWLCDHQTSFCKDRWELRPTYHPSEQRSEQKPISRIRGQQWNSVFSSKPHEPQIRVLR